jgi:periplasmic copper chaperone A
MFNRRSARRAAGVIGATAGAALLLAPAAQAHVTATPTETAAGSYTVVTLATGHGCDGSPTTGLDIKMPEGVYSVAPEVHPGWKVKKVMAVLDAPVDDGHGGQYTERVDRVVYSADEPLADGYRFATELSLQIPADAEVGSTLEFPTVQTCTKGETAWIEPTPAGGEEPELPAPAFVVAAATDGGHGAGAEADESQKSASSTSDSSDGSGPLVWVGVVAGLLGLLLGGAALLRSRRS